MSKMQLNQKAEQIKLFITDVDGVLTDGRIILGAQGQELKAFHVHDGAGIKAAQQAGIEIAIITGRTSEAVTTRADELGISEVYQGVDDKVAIYRELIAKYNLVPEEVAYIGDDVGDLPLLNEVGLSLTVADGVEQVQRAVDYSTTSCGGRGAVREVLDSILEQQEVVE
ncbi:MAG: KdsC family phosphatase [Bacillota bacterium]